MKTMYSGTIWMCAGCRDIPSRLIDIKGKFDSFIQTNQDLIACLNSKDEECANLQAKVSESESESEYESEYESE